MKIVEHKNSYLASSIGAYCFLVSILSVINFGLVKIFWIYLLLAVFFGGITAYQIYSDIKEDENKTYYFFAFDKFSFGLFFITIYLDFHYKFINFENSHIIRYLLIIGIIFLLQHLIMLRKNKV